MNIDDDKIDVFGVRIRLPFAPVMNIKRPHDAIIPIPIVRIGILDPIITSKRAKQAFKSPPGEHIPKVNSLCCFLCKISCNNPIDYR